MKIKLLFTTFLLVAALGAFAQVTENFDKVNLSSGSLACWQSDYVFQRFTSARVAAPTAQSLNLDSRLSLNSATPISGSASLRVMDSFTIPVSQGAESLETFTSPAIGQDGDVVSFKIKVNSASMPTGMTLYAVVTSGNFYYEREILASEFNSTLDLATTIDQSMGGGAIKVAIRYAYYGFMPANTTVSYSLDIDDFSTDAAIDPSNSCMTSLPVSLASFSVAKSENMVSLHWSTTQETNSDRFEIHRSADAKQWEVIGNQPSSGKSNALTTYQFNDNSPLSGRNYYRLKMVDKDGTYAYSSIRSIETENVYFKAVLFPNPVVDKIFIQGLDGEALPIGQLQAVSVVDLSGVEVCKPTHAILASGSGIDVKSLATGIYIVKVKLANGTLSSHKIMITK